MMANEQSTAAVHISSHPSGKIPQAMTGMVAVPKYSLIDQIPVALFLNFLSSCSCHDQIPAAICLNQQNDVGRFMEDEESRIKLLQTVSVFCQHLWCKTCPQVSWSL